MTQKLPANQRPLGIPLDQVLAMLQPTTIGAHVQGNRLVAKHEKYTTIVEVVPADVDDSESDRIQAVLRITTEVPSELATMFTAPGAASLINTFAALGAVTVEGGQLFIGSRLTVFKDDGAWETLHLPLITFTIIMAAEGIFGGMRRAFSGQPTVSGSSEWTAAEMAQVEHLLSRICVCSSGGLGFTAEFGLEESTITAMQGRRTTAMLQLMADQPHPEFGGGLFCLLQLPHKVGDKARLDEICCELNRLEMGADDLSPHFGAWCAGKLGDNPAYVSFLPNVLHCVDGIAANVGIWNLHRSQWASAVLGAHGVFP